MVEENWQSKLTISQANVPAYDVLPCISLKRDFDVMVKYVKPFVDSVGVLFRSGKNLSKTLLRVIGQSLKSHFVFNIGVRRMSPAIPLRPFRAGYSFWVGVKRNDSFINFQAKMGCAF